MGDLMNDRDLYFPHQIFPVREILLQRLLVKEDEIGGISGIVGGPFRKGYPLIESVETAARFVL